MDEKRRSWSMCLGQIDKYHFGIKKGWRKFIEANGVQVGDTYKFELINNGTIPLVHFHCKFFFSFSESSFSFMTLMFHNV